MSPAADHPAGLLLKVRVQPRSSRTLIAGLHGGALKLKITAPPVEGAANKMCLDYLAEVLAVPRSRLELTAGHKARVKLILVRCEDAEKPRLKRLVDELATV
jgi:hypothetical protein